MTLAPSPHILPSRGLPEPSPDKPEILRGEGAWIFDREGRRYLDAACGSGSLIFGHGDEAVLGAAMSQMRDLTVHPSSAFTVSANENYSAALAGFAPEGFTHVSTMSSGSDAVEAAMKACLQYHGSRGDLARTVFVGRDASYHGNSLMGLAAGGFVSRRAPYEQILPQWPKGEPARAAMDGGQAVSSMARAIAEAGADRVAAVIVEPVVGAALSAVAPPAGYVEGLRELCDRHGILLVADEVMTGFGRTGTPFACSAWPVSPDIIIAGKAISAGYFPLSAILVHDRVRRQIADGSSHFENGQTHCWNPVASAIGIQVVERLRDGDLLENCRAVSGWLLDTLVDTMPRTVVDDVRGQGLMIGFDLAIRGDGSAGNEASRFMRAALDRGLLVYPSSGSARTRYGQHVLLLPPLTLSREEAEHIVQSLLGACEAVRGNA